ncbi:hypothetical protein ACKUSY_11715 [Myroides odoratus]
MKKLVLFFMLATISLLSVACSSDDSKEGDKKELFLTADVNKDKVVQGTTVTFTVTTEEGEEVIAIDTGISFYINDEEAKNPYTFTELGTFHVVAKKSGYKDSNTLVVQVVEDDATETGKKLTIRVSGEQSDVVVGDDVVFEVEDEDGIVVTDATILLDTKTVVGYKWTPEAAGTYKFVAKKSGHKASDVLVVEVKEKPESQLILALIGDADRLFVNDTFQMSIKDERGRAVSKAVLYNEDVSLAIVSKDGVFDVQFAEPGTYEVKAKVNELESNVVKLTINKMAAVNTFIFKEESYSIVESTLFFSGIVELRRAVFKGEWQVEAYDADGKAAIVLFYTPATAGTGGAFDVEQPNENNTQIEAIGVMQDGDLLGLATTDLQFIFKAVSSSSEKYTGQYLANALELGGNFFSLNYNGDTAYIDDSEVEGVRGITATSSGRNLTVKADRIKRATKTLRQLGRK